MRTHERTPYMCLIIRDDRVVGAVALRDFDYERMSYWNTVRVVPMKTVRERFYDSCPRFAQEDDRYGASEGGSYPCQCEGGSTYRQTAHRNARSSFQYRMRARLVKSRELQAFGLSRLDAHRAASRMNAGY